MAFLTANSFFSAFSKILTKKKKDICASIIFKAESKPKHEDKIFWGGFFIKNQKRDFSGVQNGSFKNSNFEFVFLRFLFNVKGSFVPIFTKKY